jgi:hypothetical protein
MHFYGIQPSELRALNWDYQGALWLAIDQIEAQDLLLKLTVADYPNMTKDARKKLHREWHRKAYPKTYENMEELTTSQLAERLTAALNGK